MTARQQYSVLPDPIFKLAFQRMGEGAYILDGSGRILLANEAAKRILGWSQEELQGKQLENFIPNLINTNNTIINCETCTLNKDGQKVWLSYNMAACEPISEITARILTFRDISPKKQIEQDLNLFHSLAECAPTMLWALNLDGELIYLNKTGTDELGFTVEETSTRMGGTHEHIRTSFGGLVHPDDAPALSEQFQKALQTRENIRFEYRFKNKKGEYRWAVSAAGPLVTADKKFLGLIGSTMDIHEQKLAEEALARYTKRLEASNKELEHFATMASHDLQEPLRKIMFFISHLKNLDHAFKEEALDDVVRIERATSRMQRLISDLLDLSRITRRGQPFRKIEMHDVADEAIAELSYAFKDIRDRTALSGAMVIEADQKQMHQMMTQLLDNALKFYEPDKLSSVKINIQAINGNQCQITITDNGIGMKPEHLSRIFDAFVRLHHAGEYSGTGMGLALVQKIVERHNGSITVESTFGEGTTFTVVLPVSQAATP